MVRIKKRYKLSDIRILLLRLLPFEHEKGMPYIFTVQKSETGRAHIDAWNATLARGCFKP